MKRKQKITDFKIIYSEERGLFGYTFKLSNIKPFIKGELKIAELIQNCDKKYNKNCNLMGSCLDYETNYVFLSTKNLISNETLKLFFSSIFKLDPTADIDDTELNSIMKEVNSKKEQFLELDLLQGI